MSAEVVTKCEHLRGTEGDPASGKDYCFRYEVPSDRKTLQFLQDHCIPDLYTMFGELEPTGWDDNLEPYYYVLSSRTLNTCLLSGGPVAATTTRKQADCEAAGFSIANANPLFCAVEGNTQEGEWVLWNS